MKGLLTGCLKQRMQSLSHDGSQPVHIPSLGTNYRTPVAALFGSLGRSSLSNRSAPPIANSSPLTVDRPPQHRTS